MSEVTALLDEAAMNALAEQLVTLAKAAPHRVVNVLRRFRDETTLVERHWKQRAETAESNAALAWRRVTELQERATEVLLEHRQALATVRLQRDHANAAEAGYAESARYWERRQRSLVRRLRDMANDADDRALSAAAMLTKIDELAAEFHDHDWDGEPEPDEAES